MSDKRLLHVCLPALHDNKIAVSFSCLHICCVSHDAPLVLPDPSWSVSVPVHMQFVANNWDNAQIVSLSVGDQPGQAWAARQHHASALFGHLHASGQ